MATKGAPPTHSLTLDTATNRVSGWSYNAAESVTKTAAIHTPTMENRVISINSGATRYSYDAFGSRVQNRKPSKFPSRRHFRYCSRKTS
ncbi:MAG: hypothetical protein HY315_10485 [Acidobacteria bacterium]|nr:hypothetical protein [Acidobacteriota bacterium]